MTATQIRSKYLQFFESRNHTIIPRAMLVPQDDATTLFTGSGMQPLIPYLLGAEHPAGTRLVDSQTCFRAEDIDEVGDNRHTTYFEMLGNWSLGEYFKSEQLSYFFTFLTDTVGLDPSRLYVTAFLGDKSAGIERDDESASIWQKIFEGKNIEAKIVEIGSEEDGSKKGMQDGRIFFYDASKNWWSRAGLPKSMPAGEPGGPDSEVFYEFKDIKHDTKFGQYCHPNCECGRYMEIGNSVFMQYIKNAKGGFDKLPQRNVDFGGGLERIAAASNDDPDIFKIDLLWPIVQKVEQLSGKQYDDHTNAQRIIADHVRAGVWLAVDGVTPSNTEQGYVLRRFLRRAMRQGLELGIENDLLKALVPVVVETYAKAYSEVLNCSAAVLESFIKEEAVFRQTLKRGLREFDKLVGDKLDGQAVFKLFDTYGFPPELSIEEAESRKITIGSVWKDEFDKLMQQQKERSRTATAGQFKGGLADHSEIVTKYHTATHLMYRALRLVLGDHVVQRGSNITAERLRFDFSHPEKMTPEQIAKVEEIVNDQIAKDWPMSFREESTKAALASGVMGAFGDRYGDEVKVYTVGDPDGENYSREICGGPHVQHTGQLAEGGLRFKISKEESSSSGVRRIKAVLTK